MRKFILAILSLCLSLFIVSFSFGCSSTTPLAFNLNSFNMEGVGDAKLGYTEKCIYDVKYVEQYHSKYTKLPSITDNVIKFSFDNGKMETCLEVLASVPSEIQSDISSNLSPETSTIYKYSTKFNIDIEYSIPTTNKSGTNTDYMDTTVYFCSSQLSFAPIYSYTSANYSTITLSGSGASVSQTTIEESITYNRNNYLIKQVAENSESKEKIDTSNSYEYDFKTVVDNAQLLFLIRNLYFEGEMSSRLPVVTSSYGKATTLAISQNSSVEDIFDVNYNGNELSQIKIKHTEHEFLVASATVSGKSQLAYVQKEKDDNLEYNALLTTYVKPLIAYGNMASLGALVMNLTEVNISNK